MSRSGYGGGSWQDWGEVKIGGRPKAKPKGQTKEQQIAIARRTGQEIDTEKKCMLIASLLAGGAGGNKQSAANCYARKLDEDTETLKHKEVSLEVKLAIQRGRQAKGMSQKDLATAINEKSTVVQEYESGKAIPNQQLLGKMERALGIRLRGKNIGEPFAQPKPKPKPAPKK